MRYEKILESSKHHSASLALLAPGKTVPTGLLGGATIGAEASGVRGQDKFADFNAHKAIMREQSELSKYIAKLQKSRAPLQTLGNPKGLQSWDRKASEPQQDTMSHIWSHLSNNNHHSAAGGKVGDSRDVCMSTTRPIPRRAKSATAFRVRRAATNDVVSASVQRPSSSSAGRPQDRFLIPMVQ